MELLLNDKTKIVFELIDYCAEPPMVDIRSHYLQDVTGPVLDDNGMVRGPGGKVLQETVPTWCRCSQSITVPLERWPDFRSAVAKLVVPRG